MIDMTISWGHDLFERKRYHYVYFRHVISSNTDTNLGFGIGTSVTLLVLKGIIVFLYVHHYCTVSQMYTLYNINTKLNISGNAPVPKTIRWNSFQLEQISECLTCLYQKQRVVSEIEITDLVQSLLILLHVYNNPCLCSGVGHYLFKIFKKYRLWQYSNN